MSLGLFWHQNYSYTMFHSRVTSKSKLLFCNIRHYKVQVFMPLNDSYLLSTFTWDFTLNKLSKLSLALACHAMDPYHLRHHTITREERQLSLALACHAMDPYHVRHHTITREERQLSLAVACHAMDPYHLCHHTITREERQPRLKSRCPFATSEKDLLLTTLLNEAKAHWIARMWSVEWQLSTSRLRECTT